jgi:hypothetical protein
MATETAKSTANVKKLEAELAKAKEDTKATILANINAYLEELSDLGFEYVLAEGIPAASSKHCSKCGGAGHNSRKCTQPAS